MAEATAGAKLERIAEGREAEIFAWGDGTVLRLLRPGFGSEAQLRSEAAAMRAAAAAGVSVPAPGEVLTVSGRPGLVMQRVDGRDMLAIIGEKPWLLWPLARAFGESHARLHDTSAPQELRALHAHIVDRLNDVGSVAPDLAATARRYLDPLPDGDALCHGDFHPGNILVSDGRPVVIDWPGATRGPARRRTSRERSFWGGSASCRRDRRCRCAFWRPSGGGCWSPYTCGCIAGRARSTWPWWSSGTSCRRRHG